MTARTNSSAVTAMRKLKSALEIEYDNTTPRDNTDFCNDDNIEDAISTLSEELESLGICAPLNNAVVAYSRSMHSLQSIFVDLINASWNLVHKHRSLMKIHQDLEDSHHKVSNDNTNLTNHVKRLKENLDKKDHALCQVQERERRLKVQSERLSRDLKKEKEETTKLRKQLQSKDVQHTHELRRIQQSGQKLRSQLEKSAAGGTYAPKNKSSQMTEETEKKLRIYRETIQRLEDNNGLMLEEINELRESLALDAGGIEPQVEASEVRDDTPIRTGRECSVPAAQDSEQIRSKQRKGRKKIKRQVAIVANEEEEETRGSIRWSEKAVYEEYEEDDPSRWTPSPRIKRQPPPPSSASSYPPREWSANQPLLEVPEGEKLTKKAMKEQEKSRAAAASAEADKIKNLLIQQMQEEIKVEKYNVERQDQDDSEKASLRRVQLENTWYMIYDKKKAFMDYALKDKEEEQWFRYLTCDGLPDPSVLPDLNTYMFLWNLEDDEANMTTVTKKCEVVTYLLSRLDGIIDFSLINEPGYIEECKAIRQRLREKLQYWLDLASYRLLRQIERDMNRQDLRNARYIKEANEMICCIWALIRLPVSMKQLNERDRKNIEISFQEIDLTIKMPIDVDCYCMAIRALWVQYDHYSDQGTSFRMPDLPEEYKINLDLLSYCQKEYEEKMRIREEQAEGRKLRLEEKKAELERLMNPPQVVPSKAEKKTKGTKKTAATVIPRIKKSESEAEPERLPYLPTPEQVILSKEDEVRKEVRKLLFTRCEKTEINLRKYAILGGVYHIDLVHQPPQPKDMRRNIYLTTLQLPKELEFVPFSKPYKAPPPAPDSERTPEVIEAEMKALEAAMEALALVTLKLPDNVLWFEPPLVAHWLPERKNWSTQDVHDIKYNEEKQIITFRTGRLGIHGLAAYRFINLPYQSWEMKPETSRNSQPSRGIVLSVTAAIVQVEFIVREDLVCLHTLIGGTTTALQELLDQFMKLPSLIRKMRAGGCDLFPERDASSYVKGLPVKHTITEQHLQACMGLLSPAYSFSWSRWNATVTPRQIVVQSKELHGCVAKEQANMMLLVTPLQTSAVQCTEVSPEFSDQPVEGHESKFFADVYHLALHSAGIKSRLLMKAVSFKLATTVTTLLEATNVISMSS